MEYTECYECCDWLSEYRGAVCTACYDKSKRMYKSEDTLLDEVAVVFAKKTVAERGKFFAKLAMRIDKGVNLQ